MSVNLAMHCVTVGRKLSLPSPATCAPLPRELPGASMRSARLLNWPSAKLKTRLEANTNEKYIKVFMNKLISDNNIQYKALRFLQVFFFFLAKTFNWWINHKWWDLFYQTVFKLNITLLSSIFTKDVELYSDHKKKICHPPAGWSKSFTRIL